MQDVDGVIEGDALTKLRLLPSDFFQCCVTSPPYWRLRDSVVPGQVGLEPTPEAYIDRLVEIFAEVHRTLRADGTLWLNLGDTFHQRELLGIPWRVALALRQSGWSLRSDIVWSKPNPMPESVTDRPTRSHEFLFLLTKTGRYVYDAEAIKEDASPNKPWAERTSSGGAKALRVRGDGGNRTTMGKPAKDGKRNARSVWTIPPKHYHGAHDAVFPPELPRRCILAGSREGDVVLDPFAGSGTTLMVAKALRRHYIGIDLNVDAVVMAEGRIAAGM